MKYYITKAGYVACVAAKEIVNRGVESRSKAN